VGRPRGFVIEVGRFFGVLGCFSLLCRKAVFQEFSRGVGGLTGGGGVAPKSSERQIAYA